MSQIFRDALLKAGCRLTDTGEHFRTSAKYRGGHNPSSIAVNKLTGVFKDFGTGKSGPFNVLMSLLGQEQVDSSFTENREQKIKGPKVYSPELLKRLVPHVDFFVKRGISKETLAQYQAGMAHSGKLNRRICFPIYNRKGQIIGFAGRWFLDNAPGDVPKWKIIGRKTEFTFPCHLNHEILREKKEIIIVESIGDVISLWDAGIRNSLCLFGTELSSKQLLYIIGLQPSKIIIATNNEPDNKNIGNNAAIKIRAKLNKMFSETDIRISLPTEKDFGSMKKQEIHAWYEYTRLSQK